MSYAVMLFQNYADTASITGGSYSLPLSNAQIDDIGIVARTTNPLNASTVFVVNLGAPRVVGGLAVGPTNVSPGSTYRFRGSNVGDFASIIYDSGIKTVAGTTIDWSNTANWLAWEDVGFWEGIPNALDKDDVPVWLVDILATPVSAQFWFVEIFDTSNANGYIQFGRILVAQAFQPTINYLPNSFVPNQPIGDMSETLGGNRNFWRRGSRRQLRLEFPVLTESELFGTVFMYSRILGSDKQAFIIPDPSDTSHFQRRSFLCTLKTAPSIAQALGSIGSTVIDAEEVV